MVCSILTVFDLEEERKDSKHDEADAHHHDCTFARRTHHRPTNYEGEQDPERDYRFRVIEFHR